MKIYFIFLMLLLTQESMNDNKFELFLGRNIDELKIEAENKIHNVDNNRHSYFFFDAPLVYLNNSIHVMFFTVDGDEKISEIDIKLTSLVDKSFYDDLVNLYGEPESIMVSDGVIYEKEIDGITEQNATVRKTINKVRQGKFDENPTFIIWKKQNFEIELLMKYSQNKSEITFKKR